VPIVSEQFDPVWAIRDFAPGIHKYEKESFVDGKNQFETRRQIDSPPRNILADGAKRVTEN
jgi:hypothetical protein